MGFNIENEFEIVQKMNVISSDVSQPTEGKGEGKSNALVWMLFSLAVIGSSAAFYYGIKYHRIKIGSIETPDKNN